MRKIGLKDKNGREVCEGDILNGAYKDCVVKYCDKCKDFELFICGKQCLSCKGVLKHYEIGLLDFEVVGNILEEV